MSINRAGPKLLQIAYPKPDGVKPTEVAGYLNGIHQDIQSAAGREADAHRRKVLDQVAQLIGDLAGAVTRVAA